jgi:CRISPR type IV-associated protein Csf2
MMHTYVLDATITALSSISHSEGSRGTTSLLRREKIIQEDGTAKLVPVISGNSMRGLLRDLGMFHMLKVLGYGVDEEHGKVLGLSKEAFYFLFSGGALGKGKGKRGIDIDEARQWREIIPLVSLFGGACGNQMLHGKIKTGKVYPLCKEAAWVLPDKFTQQDLSSVWDWCQQESFTRTDDAKNDNLRLLMTAQDIKMIDVAAEEKRHKANAGKGIANAPGKSQQMRYTVETLAAGSQFYWELILDDVTDLEFEAFAVTLAELARKPYIGGKSGTGHGKIALKFENWININPRIAPEGQELATPLGQLYFEHLREQCHNIKDFLNASRL